ncbi:MAG: transcription antitermination factor NusB [Clostridia bacterium]|nr:transcription antitermination factor NusB [Clostridia bacterium]
MARSTARAAAMQLIFARMAGGEGDERTLEGLIAPDELTAEDRLYITDILEGVWSQRAELDEKIGTYARDWTVARMAKVDLAIMRLSAYELANRPDVPPAVSINEAVELTRTFSTEESGAFVNGILGNMLRDQAR